VGDPSFTGLVIVAAVAFAVPPALAFVPRLHLSAGVLELGIGIVIGSAVLGWVELDEPIRVLSTIGLAFLLFLAGLEVDPGHVRGRLLRVAGIAYAASIALAVGVGYALQGAGLVKNGPVVAVILASSYLGAVATTIADSGEAGSDLARLTLAGAAIANVATVVLLSLLVTSWWARSTPRGTTSCGASST
jgi:Kef-type K+ transport system membrane component KefB